jgi:hypothetical protein
MSGEEGRERPGGNVERAAMKDDDAGVPTEETTDEEGRRFEIGETSPLSLGEALGIIGEETRARIITELGDATRDDLPVPDALTFSELKGRVDVSDSGRFNYHLDKLVGSFVQKTDSGYMLRLPGLLVYRAIVAGTLTDRTAIEPFPVGKCPDCDGRLSAVYHPDNLVVVECEGCHKFVDGIHFPPRGVEVRSRDELLDAAYRRRHAKARLLYQGVCHTCGGTTERTLARAEDPIAAVLGHDLYFHLRCETCKESLVGHPATMARAIPDLDAAFAERGREAATVRSWDETLVTARDGTEVVDESPLTVSFAYAFADERLRVRLRDGGHVETTPESQ